MIKKLRSFWYTDDYGNNKDASVQGIGFQNSTELTGTWKEPKRAETTQNQPKRLQKAAKQPETTQSFKIGKIWNFLLAFVFQTSSPNAQICVFWVKKYQLSHLNKTLPVSYFEGADFKSDICFRKLRTQIPKFEHCGPKSIKFLILTKFCLNAILDVLISKLTFTFCVFNSHIYFIALFIDFYCLFENRSLTLQTH